ETLSAIATTQGSLEVLEDDGSGAVTRNIVSWGTPGVGAPGFTSMSAVTALAGKANADGSSVFRQGQAELLWAPPVDKRADAPIVATATVNGDLLYTEQRWEDAQGAPQQIRVDFAD